MHPKLEKLIYKSEKMPTLPIVYSKVKEAVEDPDSSFEDIARIVDMPIVTVRRWFKEGTIKTVVSQRKPRVTMSDLLEFCNRNSLRMRLG